MNKVSLSFAEAETGIVLRKDGNRNLNSEEESFSYFDSRSEAEVYMTRFLDQHPYAECCIKGEEDYEPIRVVSPKFDAYFKEKQEWLRWRYSMWPIRLFRSEPKCQLFKPY